MTILTQLSLSNYSPIHASDPKSNRRRKLINKIDEQIKIATDPSYVATRWVWVKNEDGSKRVELPKRLKRWWVNSMDGNAQLTIRYGSKVLALSKEGKNAINCNLDQVATILTKVKDAVTNGEMDEQLSKVSQYGSKKQFQKKKAS